jgi:hypothetical protein
MANDLQSWSQRQAVSAVQIRPQHALGSRRRCDSDAARPGGCGRSRHAQPEKPLSEEQYKALDEADAILEEAIAKGRSRLRAAGLPEPGESPFSCLRCSCPEYLGLAMTRCTRPTCRHSLLNRHAI